MTPTFDYQQGWATHARAEPLPADASPDFVAGWLSRWAEQGRVVEAVRVVVPGWLVEIRGVHNAQNHEIPAAPRL
jgi:hypothetical protein